MSTRKNPQSSHRLLYLLSHPQSLYLFSSFHISVYFPSFLAPAVWLVYPLKYLIKFSPFVVRLPVHQPIIILQTWTVLSYLHILPVIHLYSLHFIQPKSIEYSSYNAYILKLPRSFNVEICRLLQKPQADLRIGIVNRASYHRWVCSLRLQSGNTSLNPFKNEFSSPKQFPSQLVICNFTSAVDWYKVRRHLYFWYNSLHTK